jgi:hypothetical protein
MFKAIKMDGNIKTTIYAVSVLQGNTLFLVYYDRWIWVDATDFKPVEEGE